MTLARSLAERERLWQPNPQHFWTHDRVADALGTGPRGTRSLPGVSTDSRHVSAGDLFVALIGEHFDAHDFLGQAVAAGAGAVVVSRPQGAARLGVPVYVVSDTTTALGDLARFRRQAWEPGRLVIGITGTNGKTSTKDLTAAALASRLDVHATEGNLNNRIGLPQTLLALPDSAHAAVVELGTSLPGEIALLAKIAAPQLAIVTSVAEGHLEGLGSVQGVLREKSSIFDGAPVAITPAGQPEVAEAARGLAVRVVTAGLGRGDLAATAWGLDATGSGWLVLDGERVNVPLKGEHNLRNAMLAIAAARECGISVADAARGIAAVPEPSMRMQLLHLGAAILINDAYNSNPGSAVAAIDLLSSIAGDRQRVLVLGTMRELGPLSPALHERVAAHALASRADLIVGIGEFASAFGAIAEGEGRVLTATDVDTAWPALRARVKPNALILLKASRGVKLERIVPLIQEWAEN